MNAGVVPINNWQLALTVVLLALAGGVSSALRLGLLRSLAWGAVRTFVQLTVIGYALTYIFTFNRLWLILLVAVFMTWVAARTATGRSNVGTQYPKTLAFAALLASNLLVGWIVVALIIGPTPWYSARIAIPIFGMLLGNSMNGIALSLERMYSSTRAHAAEVEQLIAFGARPWEAIQPYVKEAVRAGMTPTINSLMVVGLVSLPGMMTGQILGGADPHQAVRYQIVVMFMIAATVAIGCLLLVGLSYRRLFTPEGALITDLQQSEQS